MNKNFLKNEADISVVIPTLNNRKEFFSEAISSINNQTLKPYEVIIVNNGKNDLILPDLPLKMKKFKIEYKSGVSSARNFGVSQSSCNFIAFLDDDDLWPQEYLMIMSNYINKYKPDCVLANLRKLKNGKIFDYKNVEGKINKDFILTRNPGITGSSIVIKKKIFFEIGGFNTRLITGEDKSLILEVINNKFQILTVPEAYAIHREHNEYNRLTNNENMAKGIYQFYKVYANQMNASQKIDNLYKINRYNWLVKKSFINFILYLLYSLCFFSKKFLKKNF